MSLSLDEAALGLARDEAWIAWGVGCHPRQVAAQETFDVRRFRHMAERTAIVGEIGLDIVDPRFGSRVPAELQLRTFRQALEALADLPRFVSIHAFRVEGRVLHELERCPITVPVLHAWYGKVPETRRAVALGCYFSVAPGVALHSKFRSGVPPDRILAETDLGYRLPPAAIPCRVEWVEHLLAHQYGLGVGDMRRWAWDNFARIIHLTGTIGLLPKGIAGYLEEI